MTPYAVHLTRLPKHYFVHFMFVSSVRFQGRVVSWEGEAKRAERYRAVGRVSRQPTRRDDNYGNRFHPVVRRRLIRRRPFAIWSVTENVAKPTSSLMDVLAGWDLSLIHI